MDSKERLQYIREEKRKRMIGTKITSYNQLGVMSNLTNRVIKNLATISVDCEPSYIKEITDKGGNPIGGYRMRPIGEIINEYRSNLIERIPKIHQHLLAYLF